MEDGFTNILTKNVNNLNFDNNSMRFGVENNFFIEQSKYILMFKFFYFKLAFLDFQDCLYFTYKPYFIAVLNLSSLTENVIY